MSEFLDDPSVLTKDKLKSALLANNVSLPNGDQRKDVYVQLYLKNLTAQNKKGVPVETFSSDDELPVPVVSNRSRSGRKATRKTDKPRPEELDVVELTDEDLRQQLQNYGIDIGPIVASTRKLYEKKLQKLLDEGPPEAVAPSVTVEEKDKNQNGSAESDHYSDHEEDMVVIEPEPIPEPEPEPEPPVVERPLRSRGRTPVTTRTRSSQHNRVSKVTVVEESPRPEAGDVLKEMFPNDVSTPTGISASCRRPIRGAAGRSGVSMDTWLNETRQRISQLQETSFTSSSSYTESRAAPSRLFSSPAPTPRPPTRPVSSTAPPGGGGRRWVPVWLRVLVVGVLAGFLFLVYQAMETNDQGPFAFLTMQQQQQPARE